MTPAAPHGAIPKQMFFALYSLVVPTESERFVARLVELTLGFGVSPGKESESLKNLFKLLRIIQPCWANFINKSNVVQINQSRHFICY
jgi:hypothetical protein